MNFVTDPFVTWRSEGPNPTTGSLNVTEISKCPETGAVTPTAALTMTAGAVASSGMIVPRADHHGRADPNRTNVALDALLNRNSIDSKPSLTASSSTAMLIVLVVSPGKKESVPLVSV
ncbi:MAG: hypothetical protein OXC29_17600 [Rhodococcus sp.]|nr:hypothetical protein [Rhodococcus sp. (in: high G+C Gram-positive bacteria)]